MYRVLSIFALASRALASHPLADAYCECPHLEHLVYRTPETVGLLSKPLELAVVNITNYTHAANYSGYSYNETHPIGMSFVSPKVRDTHVVSRGSLESC